MLGVLGEDEVCDAKLYPSAQAYGMFIVLNKPCRAEIWSASLAAGTARVN